AATRLFSAFKPFGNVFEHEHMFTSSTDNLGDMNLVRLRYLSGLFPGGAALTGATKVRVGRVRRSRHPVFFSVQAIRQ
ncbi:TPA: hypothetical protein ACHQJZ_004685, partial [Enterobacter hormaechei]